MHVERTSRSIASMIHNDTALTKQHSNIQSSLLNSIGSAEQLRKILDCCVHRAIAHFLNDRHMDAPKKAEVHQHPLGHQKNKQTEINGEHI